MEKPVIKKVKSKTFDNLENIPTIDSEVFQADSFIFKEFAGIFESTNIPLLVEDYSALNSFFNDLRNDGINDIRVYLDNHSDFIYEILSKIKIIDVNHKTLNLFGAKSKEQLTGSIEKIIIADSLFSIKEALACIYENKRYFETFSVYQRFDGEIIHCLASFIIPETDSQYSIIYIMLTDITESQKYGLSLKYFNRQLKFFIDNSPYPTIAVNINGEVEIWNPAAERIYGWKAKEVMGKICPIFPNLPVKEYYSFLEEFSKKDTPGIFERNTVSKDGSLIHSRISVLSVKDGNRKTSIFIGILEDITEHKDTENAIKVMIKSTIGMTGSDYFDNIVISLAEWIEADFAVIGEITENDSVHVISMYMKGKIAHDFEYPLKDAPCSKVVKTGFSFFPKNLQQLFPKDIDLQKMNIESYIGVCLKDQSGRIFGLMNIMSSKAIKVPQKAEEIMNIISSRVSAEIKRNKAENELRRSENELSIKNKISEVFLTMQDADIYDKVLGIILNALESKYGVFGYIDDNGEFVSPYLTKDILKECRISGENDVFKKENLVDIRDKSIKEMKSIISNKDFIVPDGHFGVHRAMSVPVIYHGTLIGNIVIGDKESDYKDSDKKLLETISDYIAPVLFSKLERNFKENERKFLDEELRKFKLGIERSGDAIFITDKDGVIIYINPAFINVYGYNENEIIGKTPRVIKSGLHSVELYKHFWKTLLKKESIKGEFVNKTKNGNLIIMEASANPIMNENGDIIGFLAIQRNITERKKFIEELKQAKQEAESANLAKSSFLANMSHELRTPLNGVLGMAQLLEGSYYGELSRKQATFVKNILQSGNHLLELINDILDLSKIEAGKMESIKEYFYPSKVVYEINNLLEKNIFEKKLDLLIKIDNNVILYNDEKKFRQVILNLVGNAIKFSNEFGQIEIFSTKNPDSFEISVKDTGIGIKNKDKEKIFMYFQQLDSSYSKKENGTGLGLALSKKLVELMGGKISFSSEYGKGSVFSFSLPNTTEYTSPYERNNNYPVSENIDNLTNNTGTNFSGKHILLIEDNTLNAEVVTNLLGVNGYNITRFNNAYDGIEFLKVSKPDLILMDIQLPGIDGISATKKIKNNPETSGIPIFALTAYAMKGDREKILSAGCEKYITKPIETKKFLNIINSFLNEKT